MQIKDHRTKIDFTVGFLDLSLVLRLAEPGRVARRTVCWLGGRYPLGFLKPEPSLLSGGCGMQLGG